MTIHITQTKIWSESFDATDVLSEPPCNQFAHAQLSAQLKHARLHLQGVRMVVTDGKAHDVDSSEMAFRTASQLAFKQGMATAGGVLLGLGRIVTLHHRSSASSQMC
jgi:hypothetical protein